jgi:pyrimidine-nucleoside phosphorylase
VREAIDTLRGNGPDDLLEVSLTIGAHLLEMAGKASSIEAGREMLTGVLRSGAGLNKLRDFIEYQGGDTRLVDDSSLLPTAPAQRELAASESGWLAGITAETIGHASVEIGAGRKRKSDNIDHSVGFVLRVKTGDRIEPGTPLLTIHAANDAAARDVEPALRSAFTIRSEPVEPPPVVIDVVK